MLPLGMICNTILDSSAFISHVKLDFSFFQPSLQLKIGYIFKPNTLKYFPIIPISVLSTSMFLFLSIEMILFVKTHIGEAGNQYFVCHIVPIATTTRMQTSSKYESTNQLPQAIKRRSENASYSLQRQ